MQAQLGVAVHGAAHVIGGSDPITVGLCPSGLIAVWHGTIANIPAGWIICDGNGGTPNLLTRFVEGVATAATDPGATGGATAKTTAGHTHLRDAGAGNVAAGASDLTTITDSIADIRPLYYDVAFIMKT